LKTTLVTIALIAATGMASAAYAQTTPPTTQPSTPAQPTMPTKPGTGMPGGTTKAPGAIGSEAAAKAQLEARGYTGIKQLKRDSGGNWTGRATKNNTEVAVTLDTKGNVREQ
jgi:hypothetical protein